MKFPDSARRTRTRQDAFPSWPIRLGPGSRATEMVALLCQQLFAAADRWPTRGRPSGDGVVAKCGWSPTSQSRRLAARTGRADGKGPTAFRGIELAETKGPVVVRSAVRTPSQALSGPRTKHTRSALIGFWDSLLKPAAGVCGGVYTSSIDVRVMSLLCGRRTGVRTGACALAPSDPPSGALFCPSDGQLCLCQFAIQC